MFNFFSKPKLNLSLPFETDIHCHILPGIDDGSPDVATSLELVERMKSWGLKRIMASPHVTKDTFENNRATTDAAMAQLKDRLDAAGCEIELSHHAEYRLDDLSKAQWEAGEVMAMPGGYVMIENPFVAEPWFVDQTVFDLQVKGFIPVMAHPERYTYYYKHPRRYDALHQAGALFQINVLSLAGAYGKEQLKMAEYLIDKGYVDFLGTDLHNVRHADIIDEYLTTRQAEKHFAALGSKLLNDKLQ